MRFFLALIAALAVLLSQPAFGQDSLQEQAQAAERMDACASVVIPGYQDLIYKLGGGTVQRGGRLVYELPTPAQLFNPAYASPLDSGIAAAAVRQFRSCGMPADPKSERLLTALQLFANRTITYGLLSMMFAEFNQDATRQLDSKVSK